MPNMTSLTLTLHRRIGEIAATDWDDCAGADNPFVSHAFLACVEESGSAGPRTGWLPQHAALRDANACGLEFVTLRGPEITPSQWQDFHRFYVSTVDRKWGSAYLTPEFFPLLGRALGERVVLMLALEGGKPVAGALNLMGSDTLYGRNWGCDRDYPFLHFELCYYRAIDFAIAQGLARVEAGAQGEHKIQRGYLPAPTYSAHWIRHSGLREAVAQFLVEERASRIEEMAALAELGPFREGQTQVNEG